MPLSSLQAGKGSRQPSPAYAWYTVIFCLMAYILSFVDRQIIASEKLACCLAES